MTIYPKTPHLVPALRVVLSDIVRRRERIWRSTRQAAMMTSSSVVDDDEEEVARLEDHQTFQAAQTMAPPPPQQRRNIEWKAKVTDDGLWARLHTTMTERHGAGEVLDQVDTFWSVPTGRLKLRVSFSVVVGEDAPRPTTTAELIAYHRPNLATTSRCSVYQRLPVADPTATGALLDACGLARSNPVVCKRRHLWVVQPQQQPYHVRVHLDEVQDLGRFVEVEVVMAANSNNEEETRIVAQEWHALLFGAADTSHYHLVDLAYVDLLCVHA